MLYLINQMILLFHFSSTVFVQKSFKFTITAISLIYEIYVYIYIDIYAFQN